MQVRALLLITSGYSRQAEPCPPCSVTKVQSHDEGNGGRSVTVVHVSVTGVLNKDNRGHGEQVGTEV